MSRGRPRRRALERMRIASLVIKYWRATGLPIDPDKPAKDSSTTVCDLVADELGLSPQHVYRIYKEILRYKPVGELESVADIFFGDGPRPGPSGTKVRRRDPLVFRSQDYSLLAKHKIPLSEPFPRLPRRSRRKKR